MKKLKSDISSAILKLLTSRGIIGDKNIQDEKVRETQQKNRQNAFHNTELLMKHYRNIAWLVECFPDSIAEELEKPFENIDKLIESLDFELTKGNFKLESRLDSMRKTRFALDRLNDALTILKRKPNDGERLYNLIYFTYITTEKLSHNQILYRLDLSSRQYYRLRVEAISILSLRLWAAPDKETDLWLELLATLEE